MIIWKPLVDKCLQCVKEPIDEVGKNAIVVARTNSHRKQELLAMCNMNIPMTVSIFCICPIVRWTSLQLENLSTVEVSIPVNFHFYGSEKAIKLVKKYYNKD